MTGTLAPVGEVLITMNYAYRIIAENRVKQIPELKLQLILNLRNKIISIKELSRVVRKIKKKNSYGKQCNIYNM